MPDETIKPQHFAVYYHPHQYSKLLLMAFETIEEAENLVKNSHRSYVKVDKSQVKHPYISIKEERHSEAEIIEIFFCQIEN
jgi:hypothetical protein